VGLAIVATIARAHDNANLKPDGRSEKTGDVGGANMSGLGLITEAESSSLRSSG
jgi:hypothetical protein